MSIFSFQSILSQNADLNVGINGGVTIGNLDNVSRMAFGVDANYLFDVFDNVKLGPSVNFVYFLTEDNAGVKPDPFIYLPLGGAIRFSGENDDFYVGADGGFALGISPNGDNGGIFFKPMVGYNFNEKVSVNFFYAGIKKKKPTYGYVGIGVVFNIFKGGNYYSF